jgi:hypothetical protein
VLRKTAVFLVSGVLWAGPGVADQAAAPVVPPAAARDSVELPPGFDGPAAPVFPEVISRDASVQVLMRATEPATKYPVADKP